MSEKGSLPAQNPYMVMHRYRSHDGPYGEEALECVEAKSMKRRVSRSDDRSEETVDEKSDY